jgi:hypothetical protein
MKCDVGIKLAQQFTMTARAVVEAHSSLEGQRITQQDRDFRIRTANTVSREALDRWIEHKALCLPCRSAAKPSS